MISRKRRDFKRFVGVDLGGGRGKNTSVAVLVEAEGHARVTFVGFRDPATGSPFYDGPLTRFLTSQPEETVVAMGAPLTLPPCLRCQLATCTGFEGCADPAVVWFRRESARRHTRDTRNATKPKVTPYTQRACELSLRKRHGLPFREAMGQSRGPLTARATHLLKRWTPRYVRDENLIEVYPKATLQVLFGKKEASQYRRGVETWEVRAQLLEELSETLNFAVWREPILQKTRLFHAVICGYTGYRWAVEGWQIPSEERDLASLDGWIWVPPGGDGS